MGTLKYFDGILLFWGSYRLKIDPNFHRRAMRGGWVGRTRERLTDPEWQNQAAWGN